MQHTSRRRYRQLACKHRICLPRLVPWQKSRVRSPTYLVVGGKDFEWKIIEEEIGIDRFDIGWYINKVFREGLWYIKKVYLKVSWGGKNEVFESCFLNDLKDKESWILYTYIVYLLDSIWYNHSQAKLVCFEPDFCYPWLWMSKTSVSVISLQNFHEHRLHLTRRRQGWHLASTRKKHIIMAKANSLKFLRCKLPNES